MSALEDICKYTELILGGKNFECDKNKKSGYRFYHSRLVANLCIYILQHCSEEDIPKKAKAEMNDKKEIICIAGMLHDIKKDDKHHADKAADELNEILKTAASYSKSEDILNISSEDIILIENMIRKHGSHGSEDKFYKFYIRLIQDADNLSRYVNFMPKEVFDMVFDITREKNIFYEVKEKVKDKHKKLNYLISSSMLKINK